MNKEAEKEITKYKAEYFVSCPKGMEELLFKELSDLSIHGLEQHSGGASFNGVNSDFLKVIFNSRLASRVYKKLFSFDVKVEKDIYHRGMEIKWKTIFDLDQTFKIQTILNKSPNGQKKSKFTNTMILSQILKDGIVDWFRADSGGNRPNVNKQNADAAFLLNIVPHDNPLSTKEKVTVLIDMCGEPLSNRGYRQEYFEAPLRENLAAALLLASDWKPQEEVLIDSMCGSGTLLVEALMLKLKIPPSFYRLKNNRHYSFEQLSLYTKDTELQDFCGKEMRAVLAAGEAGLKTQDTKMVYGFELNNHHLHTCEQTLDQCGLNKFVELKHGDATKIKAPVPSGVIICNPPYGERMGDDEAALIDLYYFYGENLKKEFKGFRAYIFTGNLPLIKKISLKTSRKIPFYNGDIECRLVRYDLY